MFEKSNLLLVLATQTKPADLEPKTVGFVLVHAGGLSFSFGDATRMGRPRTNVGVVANYMRLLVN
jgi:hypothetical protein